MNIKPKLKIFVILVMKILTLLYIISFIIGCSENNNNGIIEPITVQPPQNVPGIFYSENVVDSFLIYLDLPDEYNDTANHGYHVVYLLDADWLFYKNIDEQRTVGIISELTSHGILPPTIIVGIGYPSEEFRNRDFLSRGNDNFYAFLKDELIPQVDSLYNTQGPEGRTLIGHSFGGYFTMFSLFQYRPNQILFNNFLSISPYIMYRDYLLKSLDSLMALEINNILPLNLYLACGELEAGKMHRGFDTMTNVLNRRNYTDFEYKIVTHPNLDHLSVIYPAIRDGLTWFFIINE